MAIDFKTLTPDTSFGSGAFLFGADSQAASTPSIYGVSDVFDYLLTLSNTWTGQQTFDTPITVGNNTVNTVISSTSVTVANSTTSIALSNPTSAAISSGNYYLNANGSWSEVNLDTVNVTNTSFSVIQAVTGDNAASAINVTPTWNTNGTPTAIKLNVTDTASDAASSLMDLQVGGTSKFRVNKDGSIKITGTTSLFEGFRQDQFIIKSSFGSNYGILGTVKDTLAISGSASTSVCSLTSITEFGWTSNSTFSSITPDIILARDAADTLAQRRSTNPQTFNIYNTYTDASNYERGFLKWTSDIFELGTEASGTGSTRSVKITSDTQFSANVGINGANTSAYTLTVNGSFGVLSNTDTVFSINNNTSGTLLEVVNDSNTTVFSVTDEGSVTFDGTTATANDSVFLDLSQTWDAGANTVSGLKLNVTDTSSNASSLLMDLQKNSTSLFRVNKSDGALVVGTGGNAKYNAYGPVVRSDNGGVRWANSSNADTGSVDLVLLRDAANTLALRNSTNAQAFNIYNTYTDASNYERGFIKWNSDVLEIGTEELGTGTARSLDIKTGNTSRLTLDTTGSVEIATALTVATLPGTPVVGMIARVTDGDAALTHGQTVVNSGAGATPYLVWYNGTNWTILGT